MHCSPHKNAAERGLQQRLLVYVQAQLHRKHCPAPASKPSRSASMAQGRGTCTNNSKMQLQNAIVQYSMEMTNFNRKRLTFQICPCMPAISFLMIPCFRQSFTTAIILSGDGECMLSGSPPDMTFKASSSVRYAALNMNFPGRCVGSQDTYKHEDMA